MTGSYGVYKTGEAMDVQLDAHDLILAAHHAGIIEGVKSLQLGRGEVKNNKISGHSDFAIHYVGMLGEIAVSKVLGARLRTNITVGGDGNLDMIYHGQSLQIKTSTHANTPVPRFIIFNSLEEFSTDWAVSCSIQSPCLVRIHGFVSRKKFAAHLMKHDFGYGARFCLDEKHMSPIGRLREAITGVKT
jgi:hypothetical protein